MRPGVRILAGIAIVIAIAVGALAIVLATIDARTLIAPVIAQVERATGRKVSLGGEARIGISLAPTVQLNDVAIANAPWGSAKEILRAKRVEAQVALLPLLSRRIDIVRFTLVEPAILLETDVRGQGNWTLPPTSPTRAPSDPVSDAAGALGLGEFAIDNGTVQWRDGRTGEVTPVRIDKLVMRARDPAKPIVAEFRGSIADTPISLEGQFGSLTALQAKQWPWPVALRGSVGGRNIDAKANVAVTAEGIEANDLVYATGSSRLTGKVFYAARSPRPLIRFDLAGDSVQANELAIAGGVAVKAGAATKPSGATAPPKRSSALFSNDPLPLAALRSVDAEGTLAIGNLVLDRGRTLNAVRMRMQLVDGRLEVPDWRASAFGGTLQGRLLLDSRNDRSSAVTLSLDGRNLDLAALMALAGIARNVQGGKTDVDLDVNARGASLKDYASTLSGIAVTRIGPARWVSKTSDMPPELSQIVVALNPMAAKGGTTDLTCAVARLPFSNGVARADRSIGIETDIVGVSASGTIDLRSETLDMSVSPRVKARGLSDIGKLAGAVRVQGRIVEPRVVIDPAGSVAALLDIAALARGGRAALEGLLAKPQASGPGECAIALGGARAESRSESPRAAPPQGNDPAQEIERALGRLFRR
ncbi:MAG TPA: AsmA family protein [Casimicrobiaceae bacterium]|nr:AsmA family protein [Casimicrobiaceae bacterium]